MQTVTLTFEQVKDILYDMGLDETQDAANFWEIARKETIEPGYLRRCWDEKCADFVKRTAKEAV